MIRIDADATELTRHGQPTVGILADAKLALGALRDLLDGLPGAPRGGPNSALAKARRRRRLSTFQPQAAFAAAIRAALPDDAIIVNDLTQVTFFATVGLPVYAPRTFIGPGYQGTLGSAFATALGAQVGNPERPVVALAGDGGFLYTLGELATQRQHGLNVVSIVFDVPGLEAVITPVGGGGLLSGAALACRLAAPGTRAYGAEPAASPDAQRSLAEGRRVRLDYPPMTIADGARTVHRRAHIRRASELCAGISLVDDDAARQALALVWRTTKLLIEPTCSALPIAAIAAGAVPAERIGVVLSGGNVDAGALAETIRVEETR